MKAGIFSGIISIFKKLIPKNLQSLIKKVFSKLFSLKEWVVLKIKKIIPPTLKKKMGVLFIVVNVTVAATYIYDIVKNQGNSEVSSVSDEIGILIFFIFAGIGYILYKFDNKLTDILAPAILFVAGTLSIFDTSLDVPTAGEMIMGLFAQSVIELKLVKREKSLLFLIATLIFVLFVKSLSAKYFNITPEDMSVYYSVTIFFGAFFISTTFNKAELNRDEAKAIVEQFKRDAPFKIMGKEYWGKLIHNNQISTAMFALELAMEHLENDDPERALKSMQTGYEILDEEETAYEEIRNEITTHRKSTKEIFVLEDLLKRSKYEQNRIQYVNNAEKTTFKMVKREFYGIIDPIISNAKEAVKDIDGADYSIKVFSTKHNFNIAVSNNGPKIPWAKDDGYVDSFSFKLGHTTKEKGTGFGVHLAFEYIRAYHGNMVVTSTDDRTTFLISLPKYEEKRINEKREKRKT